MFLRRLVRWPTVDFHVKFYRDSPGALRGVAKYSDFGPMEGYISETVQDKRLKLLLMTNRKSHMSFQLVPKSVTLNDLERRNSQ